MICKVRELRFTVSLNGVDGAPTIQITGGLIQLIKARKVMVMWFELAGAVKTRQLYSAYHQIQFTTVKSRYSVFIFLFFCINCNTKCKIALAVLLLCFFLFAQQSQNLDFTAKSDFDKSDFTVTSSKSWDFIKHNGFIHTYFKH